MEDPSEPSNNPLQSVREKNDPAWNHFTLIQSSDGKNIKHYKCLHCGVIYKGGGINRMKQHLAGVKGNIAACKKVSHDIRNQMIENLKEISTKKQESQESLGSVNPYGDPVSDDRTSSFAKSQHSIVQDKGKRKLDQVESYFAPRTSTGSQPSLKSVLASKEAVHRADMTIDRWFFDCCIPMNALNSVFAQKAIDAIASIGPGYKLPSYHMLKTKDRKSVV